jgi:hypothetical protein
MAVFMLALAGCSFVGVHYPDVRPASGQVRCLTVLPIADTVAATAALSAGGYRYAVQTRTSPFPLAMVVVGAWATASAIYGHREDARCRSELASNR